MRFMKIVIWSLVSMVFSPNSLIAEGEYNPNGVWKTERGEVEIFDCGDQKCGKVVGLIEPNDPETGKPKLDKNNEEERLRSRPVLGIQNMEGFSKDGPNSWSGGTIYNPTEGKTYNSKMYMSSKDTLHVSGCVLFFCKEQTWTRIR